MGSGYTVDVTYTVRIFSHDETSDDTTFTNLYNTMLTTLGADGGAMFTAQLKLSNSELKAEYFADCTVESITLPTAWTAVSFSVQTWAPTQAPTIDAEYPGWLVGALGTVGALLLILPMMAVCYNRCLCADDKAPSTTTVLTMAPAASERDVEMSLA